MPWERAFATNDASTSFAALAVTATEPTGDGVIELAADLPGTVPADVALLFFGAGTADQTFVARVVGWDKIGSTWLPVPIAEITCTLSAMTGAAGLDLVVADKICDTLVIATAYNALLWPNVTLVSPVGDVPAHAVIACKGMRKLQIYFDMTGATSANCLVKRL